MEKIRKLITKRREPRTFKGSMRRAVTGDGRRTVHTKSFWG